MGGVGEAVVEGKTGFLVGRGDEEALRARLRTLLLSPELRARLGKRGGGATRRPSL